jgi:lysophospholipase L1-like esterase
MGLALAAVVLTLAMAEVLLRVSGFGTVKPELSFGLNAGQAFARGQFVTDRALFWKFTPAVTQTDEALGAVHPDRVIPPHAGVPRLLFLGDSCTRLTMDGSAYPARLKAIFKGRAEILTAAVPGYSSHQGLAWLRSQLLSARPDVIVVYFGWNDHWRTIGRTDRQYAASLAPWRPRLAGLWRRPAASASLRVPPDDYRANLAAIAAEAASVGARVLFVRAPAGISGAARAQLTQTGYMRPDDDPMALHAAHLRVLDEVARTARVPVLDAAGIFSRIRAGQPLLADDGIHLTGAGHRVMSVIVAQTILRDLLHLSDDPRSLDELAATAALAAAP